MVEIIIATLVFSLATAGILATLSALSRPAAESAQDTQAAFLAQEIIEDLRSQVTADAWNDPSGSFVSGDSYSQTISRDGHDYVVLYNVANDFTGAKEINVTVTW